MTSSASGAKCHVIELRRDVRREKKLEGQHFSVTSYDVKYICIRFLPLHQGLHAHNLRHGPLLRRYERSAWC